MICCIVQTPACFDGMEKYIIVLHNDAVHIALPSELLPMQRAQLPTLGTPSRHLACFMFLCGALRLVSVFDRDPSPQPHAARLNLQQQERQACQAQAVVLSPSMTSSPTLPR